MVTIPLGLGTRWPKMPVVTLAITVILILVFLFDKGQERSLKITSKLLSEASYRNAKEALFLDYCRSLKESPANCAELLPIIAPDYEKIEKKMKQKRKSSPHLKNPAETPVGKQKAKESEREKGKTSPNPKIDPRIKVDPKDKTIKKAKPQRSLAEEHHITLVYRKFEMQLKQPSPSFQKLKTFVRYDRIKRLTGQKIESSYRAEHVLTAANIEFDSVAFAQIRHGSLMHLFGNLLCLIPFGIYVELRLGALRYLLAYIFAGTIGLAFNAAFFLPAEMPLLGASANIAGIMGMFYVLFFHARMRFYLWFGVGQRVWVPVKYALPAVFFISDVSGAVQSMIPSHAGGGVAHFAHLGGLLSGMFVAWGLRLMRPVPSPFLYEHEEMDYKQLQTLPQLDRKIHMANEMLAVNVDNDLVRAAALEGILAQSAALLTPTLNQAHAFLFANLDAQCALSIRRNKHFEAYRFIAAIPLKLSFAQYLGALGQSNHLILADFALAQGNPYLAIRMYDAFLLRWQQTAKASSIRLSVIEILKALPNEGNVGAALKTYQEAQPHSALLHEIGIKISMIQSLINRHSPREEEYEPERAG